MLNPLSIFKQISLFAAASFILIIYFHIDIYKNFYNVKLSTFEDDLITQTDHMSLEDRRISRYGDSYVYTQYIKSHLDSLHVKNPIILLPPPEYLKSNNFESMMPEPLVYYYFTGFKCVNAESKNVYRANYFLFVKDKSLALNKLRDAHDVDEVLTLYKTKP